MAEKRRIPRCGHCTFYSRSSTDSFSGFCTLSKDRWLLVACNRNCCLAFHPDYTEQMRAARAHEVSPSCEK